MSERTIFLEALDIPDPAARAAFLDRECGPDADLRRRVDELLAAHAAAPGLFLEPADPAKTSVRPALAQTPRTTPREPPSGHPPTQ